MTILESSHASGHGHIPSCFSVVEIIYSVYDSMRHDPAKPSWDARDIFILSKGHASLAHYCVLARLGYFDAGKINTFGAFNSDLGCHACRCKVPGIEASTGSLGHGIGLAVGMALSFKILKNDRRVYVLIGDGEANEGSVWESIMVAVNLKLDNLTVIYDNNMSQSRGLPIPNPKERFAAFGCEAFELDGHDVGKLKTELCRKSNKVKAIVADTKKGYGCSTLVENQHEWHRKSPTETEFKNLVKELDEKTV